MVIIIRKIIIPNSGLVLGVLLIASTIFGRKVERTALLNEDFACAASCHHGATPNNKSECAVVLTFYLFIYPLGVLQISAVWSPLAPNTPLNGVPQYNRCRWWRWDKRALRTKIPCFRRVAPNGQAPASQVGNIITKTRPVR